MIYAYIHKRIIEMTKASKNKTDLAGMSKNNYKNNRAVGDVNSIHDCSSSNSYDSQMSALMLAEKALAPPTLHIYFKKEGRREKTLILLPILDELTIDQVLSLLKRTFHCSAGIVDLKKAYPAASRGAAATALTSTSLAAHDDNMEGLAISMTGNHCVAVKRLVVSRGVYAPSDIHIHG